MRNLRLITSVGLVVSVLGAYSACSPIPGRHDARGSTGRNTTEETSSVNVEGGPEMWIHAMGTPARLKQISAKGARLMIDLRKDLRPEVMRKKIGQFSNQDLGLVISLRWRDPNDKVRPVKLDVAPTAREEREAIDAIMAVLAFPESKKMEGRLWVQFFNEVTGGPGTIMPEQVEGMYAFATKTAQRIRAEAPYVKIIGPGLTAMDGLEAESSDGPMADLRRAGLSRAIEWSVANADAVDIHLHCSGPEDARHELSILKRGLERAGRGDMQIVALEWSPARFPARATDLGGAKRAMIDIYKVMAEYRVGLCAYAAFTDAPLSEVYKWAYLWDKQGQPHDPFFTTFKDLSATSGSISDSSGGETPPQETDNGRIRRRRRN